MRRFIVAVAFVCLTSSAPVNAGDLGTYGETFKIIEVDLLKMMSAKLKKMQADGTIDRHNKDMADRAKRRIENPDPIPGIRTTKEARTWLHDPSIVVQQDIADQNGRVFARRGDRINPLERLPGFDQTMLFIDARDPKQVALAKAYHMKQGAERLRIILTGGSPTDLMRKWTTVVYYDQAGIITEQLGIKQVPAYVQKEGTKLRIKEMMP
jgi:conjugal transfer pilus assembly protein TraW